MRRNNYYHWIKLQRRYRKLQARLTNNIDARLERKADIIARKLLSLNRKWRLGIAASTLTAWLAVMPTTQVQAQFPSTLNLSTLNGNNGFTINGVASGDTSGKSVSNAGDINGDGVDDLIIGAQGADPNSNSSSGSSYVVFGSTDAFTNPLELSALNGSNGFVINGVNASDRTSVVSSAGDINKDGVNDLIIGAYSVSKTYVVFGKTTAFTAALNLSDLSGTNGFVMNGVSGDKSGYSVSNAGDVNGDGTDDIIIGAYYANNGNDYDGTSYVVFGKNTAFTASMDLTSLNGTDGFSIKGTTQGKSGFSVSSAGDMNMDGIGDIIVGAYYDNGYNGKTYVVFGKNTAFTPSLNLTDLDGTTGFVLNGSNSEKAGKSVSNAGDINKDGVDDIIIGAEYNDSGYGASYVVFGKTTAFTSSLDLTALDGANGFMIKGSQDNQNGFGASVSGAGDINKDGIDDVLISIKKSRRDPGAAYVVFGKTSAFAATLDFTSIGGTAGAVINGINDSDYAGISVSNGGDINNDGIDDIIIGANGADPNGSSSGQSYVIFGSANPTIPTLVNTISDQIATEDGAFSFKVPDNTFFNIVKTQTLSATLDGGGALPSWLSFSDQTNTFTGTPLKANIGTISVRVTSTDTDMLTASDVFDIKIGDGQAFPSAFELSALNGGNGFTINGVNQGKYNGSAMSSAGDMNGDGIQDLLIGEYKSDAAFVVFGTTSGFSSLDISQLNGTNGFEIKGPGNSRFGKALSAAGDVNGDGVDDIIIGGSYLNSSKGASYVVFGKTTAFTASMDATALNGTNGFAINGVANSDYSGATVSGAGDINGDGINDVVIAATNAGANGISGAGISYVVFGKNTAFTSPLNLSALNGTNGFIVNGIGEFDRAGTALSSAGDLNNDGIGDLIIGAQSADPNGNSSAGSSYIVFGKNTAFTASLNLSALNGTNGFIINGKVGNDSSGGAVSNAGDINNDGIDDIIIGAENANSNAGESYVVFGKATAFTSPFNLTALTSTDGFTINGVANSDRAGGTVSNAGDLNKDGIDDLIIGASSVDLHGYGSNSGAGYVVFGKTASFGMALNLSDLNGTNGFILNGGNANDKAGTVVSNAGDVNGDGIADLIISAEQAAPNDQSKAGSTYVVFGIAIPTAPTVSNAIADQPTNEDAAFSFMIPANTFKDFNPGDPHTLSASAVGGGALPTWLTFDAQTNTLSGTPTNDNLGVTSIEIKATDEDGLTNTDTFDLTVNNTNDAPILAAIGDKQVAQDAALTFTAVATDVDPSPTFTFTLDATSTGKGMTINGTTGVFDWTPNAANDGIHTVTVTVSDGTVTDTEIISITVNNDPPVLAAIGDKAIDELVELTFTAAATDPEGNTRTFSLDATSLGLGMTIDGATGAFSWTPTEAQSGTHNVTVTVSDGILTDDEIITVTVNEVNLAPVLAAIGDKAVDELVNLTFTAAATDADLPANTLAYSLDATSTGLGMTIDSSTGAFSWTPTEAQSGTHSVTVSVSDGTVSADEIINITVNEVNVAPVLTVIGDKAIDETTELTFTASTTDADLPANTLAYSLDATSTGLGMSIDASSGVFSWTPNESMGGTTHTVTVTVTDGTVTDTEAITITVNDTNATPILAAIGNKAVDELSQLTFTAAATDSDDPTNTLAYSLDATSSGLEMTIDASTGVFSWIPTEAQSGTHTVKITVSDGTVTADETINITVNEVNVEPVLAAIGDKAIDETTELTFTASATDADLPANTLAYSLDATSLGKGMTINDATGAFSWMPSETLGGTTHTVTVTVSDGTVSDDETITVTVNEVNVAPVLAAIGDKAIDELIELTFTASATDSDNPVQTLVFSLDATSTGLGMTIDASSGVFSWTPNESMGGTTHTVAITVSDGTAAALETITVTVNEVNVAPVLAAIGDKAVDELVELTFTASGTDSDNPAQTLVFSLDATSTGLGMTIDSSTGAFSWTPSESQNGAHTVVVTVSDGIATASETIIVTVNEVNVTPVLAAIGDQSTDEGVELTFTASVTDADLPAQTLVFSLDATSTGLGMTIDASTGVFNWTPSESNGGAHTVTVMVSDGTATASETITVTVNEVNVAPVLAAIGDHSTDEGVELTFTASGTDSDLPANTLTFSLDATSTGLGMTIDASTGVFNWTPSESEGGAHTVIVTVSDGTATASETIAITVNEVNVAPVLAAIGDQSVDATNELTFTASATDADLPANTLTFSLDATSTGKGMTIDASTGVFGWTPVNNSQAGAHDVTIEVSDGITSSSETIVITVNTITSIGDEIGKTVEVYPNPVNNQFNLVMENSYKGALNLHIIDLSGQVLIHKAFHKGGEILNTLIDVAALKAGIYIMELRLNGEKVMIQRLIKQ